MSLVHAYQKTVSKQYILNYLDLFLGTPTLWTFINSLKNEEHFIHCQLVKLNAGEKIEPNKKYLNYSKRLRHLRMHPLPTLLEQLDGLAHNL